jgi:hypothetical protein
VTEAEWLACDDPKRMLYFLRERVSGRRMRLCWCACCDMRRREGDTGAIERAARIGERCADGLGVEQEEVSEAHGVLVEAFGLTAPDEIKKRWRLIEATYCLAEDPLQMYGHRPPPPPPGRLGRVAGLTRRLFSLVTGTPQPESLPSDAHIWCWAIRDVFGNPFRLVAFSPEWRTETAVALARGMYESRDFGAMPILADALQEAGCDCEDILNHCRDPRQVHVRGCWVVDLVLGKE